MCVTRGMEAGIGNVGVTNFRIIRKAFSLVATFEVSAEPQKIRSSFVD